MKTHGPVAGSWEFFFFFFGGGGDYTNLHRTGKVHVIQAFQVVWSSFESNLGPVMCQAIAERACHARTEPVTVPFVAHVAA